MATTRRPRKQTKHLLFPDDREIKSTQRELPKFKPHDLRSLIKEAKANDQEELKIGVLLAFRRRNDEQLKQLLQRLGVDPSKPDAWRTGFFLLAMFHHGVGHLAWYRQRTNKNAATWTSTHDLALLWEVMALQQQGLSERGAIRKIVADPKKRQMFPYRLKGYFAPAGEQQNRETALRMHWENPSGEPGECRSHGEKRSSAARYER
jgi:hypothetical protein